MVGVAYRGNIAIENVAVDFEVKSGFRLRKTVTAPGTFQEEELARLRRAIEFCPVGKLFTKRSLEIADEVEVQVGPGSRVSGLGPGEPAELTIPAGSVRAEYLPATKEFNDAGELRMEGEVKLYLSCENHERPGRWLLMGGHSGPGWLPAPVPMLNGAIAASAALTLQSIAPSKAVRDGAFQVEIPRESAGNRDQSQADAAAGIIRGRAVTRHVSLLAPASDAEVERVRSAVADDPLGRALREGVELLDEQLVTG